MADVIKLNVMEWHVKNQELFQLKKDCNVKQLVMSSGILFQFKYKYNSRKQLKFQTKRNTL